MMSKFCCSVTLATAATAFPTPPLDSKTAAAVINAEFTGDIHSGGVVVRQMGEWSLFCGEDCYKGRPDCILSTSFYNSVVGVDGTDSTFGGFFPYGWGAGVVFNGTLARERLAKCFYMFDGNSYYRYNGGCGCMAAKADQGSCDNPHAPYFNIAPDGNFVDGDNEEYAKKCLCTDVNSEQHDAAGNDCFWRGPAYNTSKGLYGGTEYGSVIQQRLNVVEPASQWRWNELVMDAALLQQILTEDPASAITAVFYHNNVILPDQNEQNKEKAQNIQSQMLDRYKIKFPIVECGLHVPVSKEKGPFVESTLGTSVIV